MGFSRNILPVNSKLTIKSYSFSKSGSAVFETPIFTQSDLQSFVFSAFRGWSDQTATYYLYLSSDGGKSYSLYKSGTPSASSPLTWQFDKYGKKINRIKITTSCTDSRVTSCCTLSWLDKAGV